MLANLITVHDVKQFEPIVVSLVKSGVVSAEIRRHNIPVIELDFSSGMRSIVSMCKLITIIKKQRPDVVHTWMYHADLVGGIGALLAGVKRIIWGIHHADPKVNKVATRIIARFCAIISGVLPTKIVACSTLAADLHARFGYSRKRMIVIENGINLSKFQRLPDCKDRKDTVIGHVARWHPIKGHEMFVRAAGIVHERLPQTRFVMVGKDIDWNNSILVSWLKQAGILEATELHGDRSDIPEVMNLFDIYVSSSKSESFSLTMIEALACGVPCVTTRTGIAEDVSSKSVRVAEIDDVPEIARLIEEIVMLSEQERLNIASDTLDLIKDRFDEKDMVRKYEELYQQVICCE